MVRLRGPCLAALLAVSVLAVCPAPGQDYGPAGVGHPPLYPLERGGVWGFVDASGHNVIPRQYERAREFHEMLAAVRILDGAP